MKSNDFTTQRRETASAVRDLILKWDGGQRAKADTVTVTFGPTIITLVNTRETFVCMYKRLLAMQRPTTNTKLTTGPYGTLVGWPKRYRITPSHHDARAAS